MGLRLATAMRRKDTRNLQFTKRIPGDLAPRLVGMRLEFPQGDGFIAITITPKMQAVRFSLGTADVEEAKQRQAEALTYWQGLVRNLKATAPIPLTPRQCVALAGELYRAWAADLEPSRGIAIQVEADGSHTVQRGMGDLEAAALAYGAEAGKAERLEGEDLERLGPLVDRLLMRRGIAAVTPEARSMLLQAFAKALAQGLRVRERKAQGDYSPDPLSERFPEWSPPVAAPTALSQLTARTVSLRTLFDDWWREAQGAGLSVSTNESYGTAIAALGQFLGHDDAVRIGPDDVVRFKDHLVSTVNARTKKPLSSKTIKGSYLVALGVVFEWAVANRRLPANPAKGVTVKVGKRKRMRNPWFTPEERKAILEQASSATAGRREPRQRFDGRRWVPWLCAYTGARVGEMVQLRKEDVRKEDGHWQLRITPEAITVKSGEWRPAPIHIHLVQMGFLEFVAAAPDGFLFLWNDADRGAWRTAKNRLTEAARMVVLDRHVQPNHGWRHTFRTIGGEAGIEGRVLDAICGWKPRTVGETYGGITLAEKAKALEQFPRYDAKPITGDAPRTAKHLKPK